MTMRVELSAMGAARPPADAAIASARRRESQGFDAIWWADHLLHWIPNAVWTPDLVPQARTQPTPHVWFDPVPVIAAAAMATGSIGLGTGVTDVVRRHPVSLAQTALTLDHLSDGRFTLGLGTGEALNLEPAGLDNTRPLARLEEALVLIRELMSSSEPVTHEGDAFTVRGAQVGLGPRGDAAPPIWLAVHRPRGLALAGRLADGWLPLCTDPDEYRAMLDRVHAAAGAAGRPPEAVTPGLYARVVVAERREEAERIVDHSLLLRFIALTRPAEAYAACGAEHPLGPDAFGLTSFLPNRYGRDAALDLARRVPEAVVRGTVILGTPDEVAERVGRFVHAGARHVQLTNMTPLADPASAARSEELLGEVVTEIRRTARFEPGR